MKTRNLRVGIVGTGCVARLKHMPAWQSIPEVTIACVADTDITKARQFAADYHIAQVVTDYRQLTDSVDVDAVDVCTPNRLHTPIVLAALAAGKHVLCEKPLAVTPAEITHMIGTQKESGRLLMVLQNHRYRGISMAMKRWIEEGHLGHVYYARAWAIRRNLLPPMQSFICKRLSGGGPCMDIGVHCLDLALWLMGFPRPVAVSGCACDHLAKSSAIPGAWGQWDCDLFDVEDFACGLVRFENGTVLSLETSWLGHIPQPEEISCTILGTRAGVHWPSGTASTVRDGRLADETIEPQPACASTHMATIRDFYDAVIRDRPSPIPAEQSLATIGILDAIYRSHHLKSEIQL